MLSDLTEPSAMPGKTVTTDPDRLLLSLVLVNCQLPFREKIPPLVLVGSFLSSSQPIKRNSTVIRERKIVFIYCFVFFILSFFVPTFVVRINYKNMKIQFWSIGKTNEAYVKQGVEDFTKRISNYFKVEWNIIPVPKNTGMLSEMDLKKKEGELILQWLDKSDYLVLLDERGKQLTSEELADFLQARANESTKKIVFLIGGAFGVADEVFKRANYKWSLSQLVFPHQLVRLILAEQIYRACTILKNEKYHHK